MSFVAWLTSLFPARFRLIRRLLLVAVLAFLLLWFRSPLFFGNFGIVDPSRVYRSAQPGSSFETTIRRTHLGSVLNLRGGTQTDEFYRREVETADRLGVEFYDLPISATHRPSRRELMLIISVLDRCHYPLLIHCKWGSDRTGLVSAMYRLVVLGEPPEAALGSFTSRYGHFPLFGPESLHQPLDEYATWLQTQGAKHTPSVFRSWLENHYQSDDDFIKWPTVRPGPRLHGRDVPETKMSRRNG